MFKFLKKTRPIVLGRWGVTYEKEILDKRINWANHDHCGSEICEKYFSDKDKGKKEKEKENNKDTEYYLPYCL